MDLYLSGLGNHEFSLKNFMVFCVNKEIDYDLKINYINDYEPDDYYLKSIINENVIIHHIKADNKDYVMGFAKYIINDSLITHLFENDRLRDYIDLKVYDDAFTNGIVDIEGMHFEIHKLMNKKLNVDNDIKV